MDSLIIQKEETFQIKRTYREFRLTYIGDKFQLIQYGTKLMSLKKKLKIKILKFLGLNWDGESSFIT